MTLGRPACALVATFAVAGFAAATTGAGRNPDPAGSGPFEPKSLVISRTSFAGIKPTMTFAQVKARWGDAPKITARPFRGIGKSMARWGNPFAYGPSAVFVYYGARQAGRQPFRYHIDLAYARQLGIELRTQFGDRAGTTLRAFRRHWSKAPRVVSEPGYVWHVAQPAFRGWRLLFLFSAGQLKDVELATADYVSRCVVRRCTVYPPQNQSRET